jgi:N-acetylglucosaminyldiphosphoundecaprenol N-acetyl-beta-D-mannosaminyltransferase
MTNIELLGVRTTVTTMAQALAAVLEDARRSRGSTVEFLAVNNFVTARRERGFAAALRTFDYTLTDGAPLVWLARCHRLKPAAERITAREMMWECCAAAERERIPVFLFGTTAETLAALRARLLRAFPELSIAGAEPSLFRPLTSGEDRALVTRVNGSGARLVFVALGCPLQEEFVASHKGAFGAVQLCVGSAFPALAGQVRIAPRIVQRLGFEWLYRLVQEPRRLWKRYFVTNSLFLLWLLGAALDRCVGRITRRFERTG